MDDDGSCFVIPILPASQRESIARESMAAVWMQTKRILLTQQGINV